MSKRACFRYRTAALLGPWRRRAEKALEDAAKAGQVRAEGAGWAVPGDIEQSLCDEGGPCGGVYPPAD